MEPYGLHCSAANELPERLSRFRILLCPNCVLFSYNYDVGDAEKNGPIIM